MRRITLREVKGYVTFPLSVSKVSNTDAFPLAQVLDLNDLWSWSLKSASEGEFRIITVLLFPMNTLETNVCP